MLVVERKLQRVPSSEAPDPFEDQSSSLLAQGGFPSPLSNVTILLIASLLFGCFAVAELIAALHCKSLALLGDAACMLLDVITYLAGLIAERLRARHGSLDLPARRLTELLIPSLSLFSLLSVTICLIIDAILVLRRGDYGRNDPVQAETMLAFAIVNYLIDILVLSCFLSQGKNSSLFVVETMNPYRESPFCNNSAGIVPPQPPPQTLPNLNMLSAFAHVGSDALRTTGVFVAAIVAMSLKHDQVECDAWAALVVALSILAGVTPLVVTLQRSSSSFAANPFTDISSSTV
eukprot:scaffold2646_cov184-Ochromonas_danica.AAC.1